MMETKTFKQGDKFTWEGELFIMSRPPLLRGLLACGSQGTTIGENKVRSLLAGGLIAIHREVPEEPFVIEEAHIGTSRDSGFTYGRCLRLDNIPEDRFEHGEVVKVTIEKVKP